MSWEDGDLYVKKFNRIQRRDSTFLPRIYDEGLMEGKILPIYAA